MIGPFPGEWFDPALSCLRQVEYEQKLLEMCERCGGVPRCAELDRDLDALVAHAVDELILAAGALP